MSDWTSVRDRLPDDDRLVLVCTAKGHRPVVARLHYRRVILRFVTGINDHKIVEDVTHWMEIPEAPKPEPRFEVKWCPGEWASVYDTQGCVNVARFNRAQDAMEHAARKNAE